MSVIKQDETKNYLIAILELDGQYSLRIVKKENNEMITVKTSKTASELDELFYKELKKYQNAK